MARERAWGGEARWLGCSRWVLLVNTLLVSALCWICHLPGCSQKCQTGPGAKGTFGLDISVQQPRNWSSICPSLGNWDRT